MPELPEVETVINNLRKSIIGSKILSIDIFYPKLLKNSNEAEFIKNINLSNITNIDRKGKFIIIGLSNQKYLIIHLRMEGKLFFESFDTPPTHPQLLAEFKLSNGYLRYYDTRKFGTFDLINFSELNKFSALQKLGPDANSSDIDINLTYSKIKNKNVSIKTLLLDQTILAGIGNIYANEILYAAKINPFKKGNQITINEWELILKHAYKILNDSIIHHGTTIHSYKFDTNNSGGYQKYLKVHGFKNLPCKTCNNLISYQKINGRGCFYCKKCQK